MMLLLMASLMALLMALLMVFLWHCYGIINDDSINDIVIGVVMALLMEVSL